jgi:hypothetical protein
LPIHQNNPLALVITDIASGDESSKLFADLFRKTSRLPTVLQ